MKCKTCWYFEEKSPETPPAILGGSERASWEYTQTTFDGECRRYPKPLRKKETYYCGNYFPRHGE